MIKFLKSIDIYGHPISVLYRGEKTHNTLLGSVFSILTTAVVLFFALDRLIKMLSYENQDEIVRSVLSDIDQEGRIILKEYDLRLMFQTSVSLSNGGVDFNYRIPQRIGSWRTYIKRFTENFQAIE